MGIRYLGSKARVLDDLASLIGQPSVKGGRFVDGFSGTGVVASKAADLGWDVHVNDHLRCARLLSTARMLAESDVSYSELGGYSGAVEQLNATPGVQGFIWREYSPASSEHAPRPRRYFTEDNGARLDGMRCQVRQWSSDGVISCVEEDLLLADLIESASAVANTAGTFGCFLSEWSSTARRQARVKPRVLRKEPVRFSAGELDVFSVLTEREDTVYLDPPYTKRHYAAYYHVLETLAYGDEPDVSGVTGLRPREQKVSPFYYKNRALPAMLSLIERICAGRILISYSDDGHIDLDELVRGLEPGGTVEVHDLGEVPRYQPRGPVVRSVAEFVIELHRRMSVV